MVPQEMQILWEKAKIYSTKELFSMSKKYMDDSEYLKAYILFYELKERKSMREISTLYSSLIPILTHYEEESDIDNIIQCMTLSTEMHAEGSLPKEELFNLETLIDRIPFRKMIIPYRDEFERIYCRFKEYSVKVFLEEQKKK